MPRTARAVVGGLCHHVINRGNGRATVFDGPEDYGAFLGLMAEAGEAVPMRVAGFCLMPNHFHLVLWPREDGELSRWMQRLMTAHVRRRHAARRSSGHVWQGRFKAFPIQQDGHLLAVLRYVERNPLRAGLVARAEEWRWSSLGAPSALPLSSPLPRPEGWAEHVNAPQSEAELEALRRSVVRGVPFGDEEWQRVTAEQLDLGFTLRPRGRPKKVAEILNDSNAQMELMK